MTFPDRLASSLQRLRPFEWTLLALALLCGIGAFTVKPLVRELDPELAGDASIARNPTLYAETLLAQVESGSVPPGVHGFQADPRGNGNDWIVSFSPPLPATALFVAFGPEASGSRAPRRVRDDSEAAGPTRAQVGYSTRVTERRLAELQADGRLDPRLDPGVAARAFVAMQNTVVCWWLEDPSRATRAALVETLVRLHPAVAAAVG